MEFLSKVLFVDDDFDDRQFFAEAMQEIDPNVKLDLAKDGFEAIEKLKNSETPPDIIFLDLNMPKMNGKQCLQAIKRLKKFSTIPIIIYSTSFSEQEELETLSLGASYFLQKPSDFNAICSTISSVFSREFKNMAQRIY